MRTAFASVALSASAASIASAFVGTPLGLRALNRPPCSARTYAVRSTRMSTEAGAEEKVDEDAKPKVYYASEVTEGNEKTKFTETFGEKGLEDFSTNESDRYGPVNYDNFVDGEGFDGGDGQVGVVGDGSNAMEVFDNKAVGQKKDMQAKLKKSTMVKESKSRQRNAWGAGNTGYADKLKEEGMVTIDLDGEDVSKIRRQQFENWRNQQEITSMQRAKIAEMERITGTADVEDRPKWKRGKASYFDQMNKPQVQENDQAWNKYSAPRTSGKKDGSEWTNAELTGDEKVEGTIQCISISGRPGHTLLEVKNSVMTFEPFHCTWVGDSKGFSVSPDEGTLNRRNGDATSLDVSYLGSGPADNRIGTLVIETEEDKWVYKTGYLTGLQTEFNTMPPKA